jgi:hypothetical protein
MNQFIVEWRIKCSLYSKCVETWSRPSTETPDTGSRPAMLASVVLRVWTFPHGWFLLPDSSGRVMNGKGLGGCLDSLRNNRTWMKRLLVQMKLEL